MISVQVFPPQVLFCCTADASGHLPLFGKNLDPIAVWIFDEVDPHCGIFVTDAAHLFVLLMGGIVVIDDQGEVKLVVAKVVGFLAVLQPGKFQLMAGIPISKEYQPEALIGWFILPHFHESQGIAIELQALVEIPHVDIVVIESEIHCTFSRPHSSLCRKMVVAIKPTTTSLASARTASDFRVLAGSSGKSSTIAANKPTISLTDRASFLIMRERSIKHAFSFDRHFAQHGFHLLPRR
jgi:hypothetical protein